MAISSDQGASLPKSSDDDEDTLAAEPVSSPPHSPLHDQFAELYQTPTIDGMRDLGARGLEFERFVKYVLDHAGYQAKHTGPFFKGGVDVELLERVDHGKARFLGGVECKRYNRQQPVGRDPVQKLAGARVLKRSLPGYLITTSTFTKPARE